MGERTEGLEMTWMRKTSARRGRQSLRKARKIKFSPFWLKIRIPESILGGRGEERGCPGGWGDFGSDFFFKKEKTKKRKDDLRGKQREGRGWDGISRDRYCMYVLRTDRYCGVLSARSEPNLSACGCGYCMAVATVWRWLLYGGGFCMVATAAGLSISLFMTSHGIQFYTNALIVSTNQIVQFQFQ